MDFKNTNTQNADDAEGCADDKVEQMIELMKQRRLLNTTLSPVRANKHYKDLSKDRYLVNKRDKLQHSANLKSMIGGQLQDSPTYSCNYTAASTS